MTNDTNDAAARVSNSMCLRQRGTWPTSVCRFSARRAENLHTTKRKSTALPKAKSGGLPAAKSDSLSSGNERILKERTVMPQIRQARHGDIDALLDLQQRYWEFEQIDHFDRQRNSRMLADFLGSLHYGALFVAQSRPDRLDGYVIACLQYSFEYGGVVATIDELYVGEHARSEGLGGALLAQLEAYVRGLGGAAIALEVDHHNAPALAFYLKHGVARRSKYQTMLRELRSAT
jgi:ribosomal protein S18 acetylase RimI-like enzyme